MSAPEKELLSIIHKLQGLLILTFILGERIGVVQEEKILTGLDDCFNKENAEKLKEIYHESRASDLENLFGISVTIQEDIAELVRKLLDSETKGEEQA